MYRYRTICSSHKVLARFEKHRKRLGRIVRVEARRFMSWRGKGENAYNWRHDRLLASLEFHLDWRYANW